MSPPDELQCRIVATHEPNSSLWTFFLINDGGGTIESAELKAVRYEWGDQYVGGESPGGHIADLAPGARAVIWRSDGSSEMRTDLWLRVTHQGLDTWLLFEFPRLYRQQGTTLVAQPTRTGGPPFGVP
jgi:hypothetical protein